MMPGRTRAPGLTSMRSMTNDVWAIAGAAVDATMRTSSNRSLDMMPPFAELRIARGVPDKEHAFSMSCARYGPVTVRIAAHHCQVARTSVRRNTLPAGELGGKVRAPPVSGRGLRG